MSIGVEDTAQTCFVTSCCGPVGRECLDSDDTVRKNVLNRIPPAVDYTVWATDERELGVDDVARQDSGERLPSAGPRPISDSFAVLDSASHETLHEVRRCRFPASGESVSIRDGQILRPAILAKKLGSNPF